MELYEYIRPELLILIPVMYLIGAAIKKSRIKDNYIPLILGCISVLLCTVWVLANSELNGVNGFFTAVFTSLTQGILIAGASVYLNQIIKQHGKSDDGKK